ncbi:hypothetical protein EPUS_03672 [Endocarpon pusillum Z07020]|uniref:Uncharacterized protein n=1 Tax=Endocarpon pusillum (strain Z07020 / HMAS-L-300199) TaxID=1263415 RepID=U1HHQ3_ENDPU|nr:uncharacterized protein EPUS_03672 [Endocarpon pusillum Z07020]ERF69680.1 hypothetical protein EPUS_03672 [Endocarpon pusillum Z07020]
MTRHEATERVHSQWDVRLKAERCLARKEGEEARGLVIWNDGDKEELRREVGLVMEKVRRTSPRWWSWVCLLVPPVGFAAASWQLVRNLLDSWAWKRRRKMEKAKL